MKISKNCKAGLCEAVKERTKKKMQEIHDEMDIAIEKAREKLLKKQVA